MSCDGGCDGGKPIQPPPDCKITCDHRFCSVCWNQYLKLEFEKKRQTVETIRCPLTFFDSPPPLAPTAGATSAAAAPAPVKLLCDRFLSAAEFQVVASDELKTIYRNRTRTAVFQTPDRKQLIAARGSELTDSADATPQARALYHATHNPDLWDAMGFTAKRAPREGLEDWLGGSSIGVADFHPTFGQTVSAYEQWVKGIPQPKTSGGSGSGGAASIDRLVVPTPSQNTIYLVQFGQVQLVATAATASGSGGGDVDGSEIEVVWDAKQLATLRANPAATAAAGADPKSTAADTKTGPDTKSQHKTLEPTPTAQPSYSTPFTRLVLASPTAGTVDVSLPPPDSKARAELLADDRPSVNLPPDTAKLHSYLAELSGERVPVVSNFAAAQAKADSTNALPIEEVRKQLTNSESKLADLWTEQKQRTADCVELLAQLKAKQNEAVQGFTAAVGAASTKVLKFEVNPPRAVLIFTDLPSAKPRPIKGTDLVGIPVPVRTAISEAVLLGRKYSDQRQLLDRVTKETTEMKADIADWKAHVARLTGGAGSGGDSKSAPAASASGSGGSGGGAAESSGAAASAKHAYAYAPPLELLAQYLEIYFGARVVILPTLDHNELMKRGITADLSDSGHVRFQTAHCLGALIEMKKHYADAYAMVGVTQADLWVGAGASENFLFGEAWENDKIGVFSFLRYTPYFELPKTAAARGTGAVDNATARMHFTRRCLHVLSHEVGHLYGMTAHCVFFECVMNGCNHTNEIDRSVLSLCPLCLRKLSLALANLPTTSTTSTAAVTTTDHKPATGLDVLRRYEKLLAFYSDSGFVRDVADTKRILLALNATLSNNVPAAATAAPVSTTG